MQVCLLLHVQTPVGCGPAREPREENLKFQSAAHDSLQAGGGGGGGGGE